MSFKEMSADLIKWAIENGDPEILPMWILDSTRLNPKKPATLEVACPDSWSLNVRGDKPRDIYLMLKIPQEQHETWVNAQASPGAIKEGLGMVASGGETINDHPTKETK